MVDSCNFNIESVCIKNNAIVNRKEDAKVYDFIVNYKQISRFFEILTTQFLEGESAKERIEGLSILLKAFVQAEAHLNGSWCASVLYEKIENLALVYPNSIKKVIQKSEYTHNKKLVDVIERINYLVKPKFFDGYSPFKTRFSYHLSKQLGLFTTTAQTSAVAMLGLIWMATASQSMIPTQSDSEITQAGYILGGLQAALGSTLFASNVVVPIFRINKEPSVSIENPLPEEEVRSGASSRSPSCVTITVAEAASPDLSGSNSPNQSGPSSPAPPPISNNSLPRGSLLRPQPTPFHALPTVSEERAAVDETALEIDVDNTLSEV